MKVKRKKYNMQLSKCDVIETYICVLLPLCAPVHPGLTVTF